MKIQCVVCHNSFSIYFNAIHAELKTCSVFSSTNPAADMKASSITQSRDLYMFDVSPEPVELLPDADAAHERKCRKKKSSAAVT